MPRRRVVPKRPVDPDPRFNSVMVSKFINRMMLNGKKNTARTIFYDAMDLLESRIKEASPVEVFEGAVDHIRPRLEVKSRRVGGATYQVPVEVRPERRNALAFRWLVGFARQRPGKSMAEKLAAELADAFQNRGAAVKKKEDTHRMAEANKAFAHYRW
ncbi:30S ribosomal protein S7 [Desulfurivibrio dismutans]|uniref:30S ribosomal protein S7 n=1 Tax=Desulfurivibrio dismutans TaxID=1398908 RepID=UPI0023D98E35|nr:30S ribosomal protein S7 [Desulfurivibrio alkaliphilus]MDF1613453.1 30S ribosomal protein S7 [Desulfurivibrio alkaliphilus]